MKTDVSFLLTNFICWTLRDLYMSLWSWNTRRKLPMARSPKTKPLAEQGPEVESDWASAAELALALALVDENAPMLAEIFDRFLAPTGDGGFVVPIERQPEFHRKLASALTVAASRNRSILELLDIARAFHRLGEVDEAMKALQEGFVRIVASHSPGLQARQKFLETPVAGTA